MVFMVDFCSSMLAVVPYWPSVTTVRAFESFVLRHLLLTDRRPAEPPSTTPLPAFSRLFSPDFGVLDMPRDEGITDLTRGRTTGP